MKESIGYIMVGAGTPTQRKIEIINRLAFEFFDHRLITISELEGNEGFSLMVENPKSTGRSDQSILWVSEYSFKALIHSLNVYHASKGWVIADELPLLLGRDLLHYQVEGNIECVFDKVKQEQLPLASGMRLMPALCLDLDGTVRRSKSGKSFLANADDIELMPGIEKLIWDYRNMGYIIIGISNQGGVAHGFKLPAEIDNEIEATKQLFANNPFHIIKACYHMADGTVEPYNHRSLLRKPDIGMLAEAERELFETGCIVDWDNSLLVGDRPEDEECAKNARIKFEHIDIFLVSPKVFDVK